MHGIKVIGVGAVALFAATTTAIAADDVFVSDFGTEAESRDMAGVMVEIIQTDGLEAGIAAMHDPEQPFADTPMGVHVFEAAIIVADNREPELIASSYEEIADLTNEPMWPRIVEAANTDSEAILEWYHYDTEE